MLDSFVLSARRRAEPQSKLASPYGDLRLPPPPEGAFRAREWLRLFRQFGPGLAQPAKPTDDYPPPLQGQPARERLAQDRHVAKMRLEVDELNARLKAVLVGVRRKRSEEPHRVPGERPRVAAAVFARSRGDRDGRRGKSGVGGNREPLHGLVVRGRTATACEEEDHRKQPGSTRRRKKVRFSPAKIAETESSAKMFMIVSASRPETGRTSTLSGRLIGSIGTVSVTVTWASSLSPIFSNALPGKRPCVAQA